MEYMFHGSLYDILHNETMVLEGDILLPIMRDISSGLRFLHASRPQILHGDLKVRVMSITWESGEEGFSPRLTILPSLLRDTLSSLLIVALSPKTF